MEEVGRKVEFSHTESNRNYFSNANLARSHTDRRSTSGYYSLVGENLVFWKVRNKMWLLDLVQKLTIELWQWQHVNSYGSNNY
uniref:Uncharacterized protein n=1 Tax=Solanum lycopersicum TaxID=4081 RepID=A0A3Q7IGZ7_SOLLC